MSFTPEEFDDCFGDDIRLATWARNHGIPAIKKVVLCTRRTPLLTDGAIKQSRDAVEAIPDYEEYEP